MEEQKESIVVDKKLTLPKKVLLYSLYSLLILMVVFSFLAIQNTGEKGYLQCVENKCEAKGEKFCSKPRELSNCCAGAGGNLAGVNNPQPGESPYTCVFD